MTFFTAINISAIKVSSSSIQNEDKNLNARSTGGDAAAFLVM